MAQDVLVRAKILKVSGTPLQFFTKNNLRIQKARFGRFPPCPINLSSLLFIVPYNQQGNQVKFAFAIKALVILYRYYIGKQR